MKTNNCKHPEAYVSRIGNYWLCNICGETFLAKKPEWKDATEIKLSPEVIEKLDNEVKKPKRKYTRRQKLDI